MPNRSRLRRLAAFVLLLWLFGLTSGVVNACVVASGLRHAVHAAAAEAAHDHAMHRADAAAAQAAQHEQDEQPPCERLCDEPVAPAQADKQVSTLSGFWLAAAPPASLPAWQAVARKAPLPPAERAFRAALAIPIVYLRLAL